MRTLLATGQPETLVTFGTAELPRPQPDEALVKVAAFSVNRGEIFLLEDPRPGWRPGKDISGVVTQAAADGTGPPVGWADTAATLTDLRQRRIRGNAVLTVSLGPQRLCQA